MKPVIPTKACLLIVSSLLLPGCLDDKADPTFVASSPATSPKESPAFPVHEHELIVPYWVASGTIPLFLPPPGHEDAWKVLVPGVADNVTLNATWSPSSPLAEIQHCMIHGAEGDNPGPMLGEGMGPTPLRVPRTSLPNGTRTLIVMCMPMNDPVAVEFMQRIHLKVEFSRGEQA